MTHRIYLVDASPYIFRAFFSLPASIVAPNGQPANAVHGFGSFLLKLIQDERPSHLALAFDRSLTTSFRNEIYPDYKAQRELPPADLEAQLDWCERLGLALGVCTFASQRYEADDLLATLCQPLAAAGEAPVVVSSDKDLLQLVDERVGMYDFARGERYGPPEVVAKLGVQPAQVSDFLGLAGDSVDNIPGVPGVGPKTAVALLQNFPSLEAIYQNLDRVAELEIRGARALQRRLEQHEERALLSKQLATLAMDDSLTVHLDELEYQGADVELLDPLLTELGFERFRTRIRQWQGGEPS